MERFDTEFTDKVVCPHCGREHSDSWELDDCDEEFECGWCGKTFAYERHVSITYSSWKGSCDETD